MRSGFRRSGIYQQAGVQSPAEEQRWAESLNMFSLQQLGIPNGPRRLLKGLIQRELGRNAKINVPSFIEAFVDDKGELDVNKLAILDRNLPSVLNTLTSNRVLILEGGRYVLNPTLQEEKDASEPEADAPEDELDMKAIHKATAEAATAALVEALSTPTKIDFASEDAATQTALRKYLDLDSTATEVPEDLLEISVNSLLEIVILATHKQVRMEDDKLLIKYMLNSGYLHFDQSTGEYSQTSKWISLCEKVEGAEA